MSRRVYLRKVRQKGTQGHFLCVCICKYGNFANWQSGNHKLYLLSTEESCETGLPPEIQTHCLSEMEKKKKEREKLSACIHSSVLGTQFKWSIQEKKKEQRDRRKVSEGLSLVWEAFHHLFSVRLSHCSAQFCQLFGGKHPAEPRLSTANLGRFEATRNEQFCIITTSF